MAERFKSFITKSAEKKKKQQASRSDRSRDRSQEDTQESATNTVQESASGPEAKPTTAFKQAQVQVPAKTTTAPKIAFASNPPVQEPFEESENLPVHSSAQVTSTS